MIARTASLPEGQASFGPGAITIVMRDLPEKHCDGGRRCCRTNATDNGDTDVMQLNMTCSLTDDT